MRCWRTSLGALTVVELIVEKLQVFLDSSIPLNSDGLDRIPRVGLIGHSPRNCFDNDANLRRRRPKINQAGTSTPGDTTLDPKVVQVWAPRPKSKQGAKRKGATLKGKRVSGSPRAKRLITIRAFPSLARKRVWRVWAKVQELSKSLTTVRQEKKSCVGGKDLPTYLCRVCMSGYNSSIAP